MQTQHTSKRCTKCRETKPVAEFYRDRQKRDGLRSSCKPCQSESRRRYRKANPDKERERRRVYYEANRDKLRERVQGRAYREANPEKVRERHRVYHASPAGKATAARASKKVPLVASRAKSAVQRAVKAGRMLPAKEHTCLCGKPAAHWHHPDYNEPLQVVAMCRSCHYGWHRSLIPAGLQVSEVLP